MQQFSFPTNILFGAGVVAQLPAYLKEQGLSKPMLVTDPQVAQLDFFKNILEDLSSRNGLSVTTFSDIHKNPQKSDVLAGKSQYVEGSDCIVGVGGGAALDVARAVTMSINHHRDLFDYDDLEGGSQYITEPVPHFVTIPTTSGTGSEVGRAAIISEDASKRKRILFHPKLMARQVFADPELTYELPPEITAATGMDALTHNIEAFLAQGHHPMCDGIALEGVYLISQALSAAVKNPTEQARSDMMLASMMGAVAFQKGLGIVHALAHPLSTLLDMHHGLANAVNLPVGLSFNQEVRVDHFKRLAGVLGLKSGEEVVPYVKALNAELGIPDNLISCGVKEEHVDALVDLAAQDFCLPANPRQPTRSELMDLYRSNLRV